LRSRLRFVARTRRIVIRPNKRNCTSAIYGVYSTKTGIIGLAQTFRKKGRRVKSRTRKTQHFRSICDGRPVSHAKVTSLVLVVIGVMSISSVVTIAVLGQPARAASFPCEAAKTFVEKAVCADPKLSADDEAIARRWRVARQSGDDGQVLLEKQREWLRSRNTCRDLSCVRKSYRARLLSLDQLGQSVTIQLPGSVAGNALVCPASGQCTTLNPNDETPVFVISQDSEGKAKVRIRSRTFTTDVSSVVVTYKGCRVSLRSFDMHSYCSGVK
jgi:uncharacterized protein